MAGAQAGAGPAGGRSRGLVAVLAALVGWGALALHARHWWPYLSDDALISLRYARRLLDGHGLTWTDGPAVEGYSNLLQVLACAALGALGLELVDAARAVGLGASAAWIGAAAWLGARDGPAGAAAAVAVLAASGVVGVWAIGGLEQPLVGALLALTLVGVVDGQRRLAMAAMVLLAWARPDAPLLVALVVVGAWLGGGQDRRAALQAFALAVPAALATLAQLAFRLWTYDDWVPNTAHVKLPGGSDQLDSGALYVWEALGAHGPSLALAGLGLVLGGVSAPAVRRLAVPLVGGWLAYVVWIGGDIFPAYRHFVPALVGLAALAGTAGAGLARLRGGGPVLAVALVLGAGLQVRTQLSHRAWLRADHERWVWDGQVIGQLLGVAFPGARVAVSAAGCVPYWSGLPALDMLGLNDRWIATHPPADAGGWVGHTLGDGAYVLEQAPDLLLFCGPRGGGTACYRSEHELLDLPAFEEGHRLVRVLGEDPHEVPAEVWVRLDGRGGLVRQAGSVTVPGWLVEGPGAARWDGAALVRPVGAEPARLVLPPFAAGLQVREVAGQGGLQAEVVAGVLQVSGPGTLQRVVLGPAPAEPER